MTGQACNKDNAEDWFAPAGDLEGLQARARAKEACKSCPVKGPCLELALSYPDSEGIWAGTTKDERKKIRRRRIQDMVRSINAHTAMAAVTANAKTPHRLHIVTADRQRMACCDSQPLPGSLTQAADVPWAERCSKPLCADVWEALDKQAVRCA